MKRRNFIFAMITCLALLAALMLGMVACNPKAQPSGEEVYYLSQKSTGWQTFASAADVPSGVLFALKEGKLGVEVSIEEGDEFTVNKVGGDKLGFDAVFSSLDALVAGEQNVIKVAKTGTYVISLDGGTITYAFTAAVSGVQIVAPAAVLEKDSQYQFAAVVNMSDGTQTDGVSWSSSNVQVASVSASGLVTALAVGHATIKATSTADPAKFAEYEVEVKLGVIKVESVTVTPSEVLLDEGETATLTADISPANADDKTVIWESDNLDVATVDGGTVTALSPGVAHITVRTRDGGKEATATVTVRQPVQAIDVVSEIELAINGAARIIRPTLLPKSSTNKKIRAYTDDTEIIEIEMLDDDTAFSVKAIGGTSTQTVRVTVQSVDNPEVTYSIRVMLRNEGTKLAWFTEPRFNVNVGDTHDVEVISDNAEIESVTWYTDNANASVEGQNENGRFTATVTGQSMGLSKIYATVNFMDDSSVNVTASAYVADDFFFIYGIGLDENGPDWDFESYIANENKARQDGRLLEQKNLGSFVLTRKLTPDMGFQIIFPSVTANWEKAIKYPSVYYYPSSSTDKYISNTADQFRVNTPGTYRIILQLTTSSPTVHFGLEQLDVSMVELSVSSMQKNILKEGERTVIQSKVLPEEGVDYTTDEFKWSASVDAEDAKIGDEFITIPSLGAQVEYYPSLDNTTMTVNVLKADSAFNITFSLELRGIVGYFTIPIVGKNDVVVPVSEVTFEQSEYLVNVNNGGADWATTVKAAVNEDATMQGVVYSLSVPNTIARVDRLTGEFTARAFGVFTVTATALGDSTKTATAQIKVYSDSFYLSGAIAGKLGWEDPAVLPQGATSLEGTAFEQFKFNDTGDHVHFSMTSELRRGDTFQIVYLGMDDSWTNALTNKNLDVDDSPCAIEFETNMQVNSNGLYEIIVDISRATDDGFTPVVGVHCLRTYPASFKMNRLGDQGALKQGDEFKLQINEISLNKYYNDFEFFAEEGYEDYFEMTDYDAYTMTATFTVLKEPESGIIEFKVFAKLYYLEQSVTIAVISSSEEEVLPKTLVFDNDHYYFNVNNGGLAWEQQVIANVDDNATDKRVRYTLKSAPSTASIDPNTGIVTTKKLGTFTVVATSCADSSLTAETLVTFYSDTMYLIGEIGDLQTYATLPPTTTSLEGTGVYERYAFTMVDQTHFYLERTLEKMKLKAGNYDDYEYGFQIAYLGVDTMAVGVIQLGCYNAAGSYQAETYLAPRDKSMRVNVTGVYRIEVSLEGTSPRFTVNFKGISEQELNATANDVLFNEGDSVDITLQVLPDWIEPEEGKFSYEIVRAESGADLSEYVGLSLDFDAMKLVANVKKAPLTGDISAIVRVSYGEVSGELAVTIVGTHHLEMRSDDQHHWMQCADADCDYIEGEKAEHTRSELRYYDNMTHYYQCSTCGRRFDEHNHFELDAEGYYDGTKVVCECGFRAYEINNSGVITKYNGGYGKLKLPSDINGLQVKGIANNVFRNMTFITDVKLCDSITSVGMYAFQNTRLSEIVVKAGVTYGQWAYQSVKSATDAYVSVKIEDGVTEIADMMFADVTMDIDFSQVHTLKTIGSDAFSSVTFKNRTIDLPDGLLTIKQNAFRGTYGVYEMTVPDSVTSVAKQSLYSQSLRRVTLGAGLTDFYETDDLVNNYHISEVVFKGQVTRMDHKILGEALNVRARSKNYELQKDSILAIYFKMTVDQIKNISFGNKSLSGWHPFSSDEHENINDMYRALDNRNGFLYDPETHMKRMYYYSEVRPASDADEWEFAGAWHYDKDGNVQKWSDTPLEEG